MQSVQIVQIVQIKRSNAEQAVLVGHRPFSVHLSRSDADGAVAEGEAVVWARAVCQAGAVCTDGQRTGLELSPRTKVRPEVAT